MNLLDYDLIRDFYNDHTNCWAPDLFSQMTTAFIDKFVSKIIKSLNDTSVLLNAGSGGKIYETDAKQIHIDIAENTLKNVQNSYIGNIINMPFNNGYFDCIVCVGTVINYCEADKAIKEFNRVMKHNAILILEYERINSGFVVKPLKNLDYNHTIKIISAAVKESLKLKD